ncbi:MAG: putative porin [Prosthecochloris sp.]|nr:putative porin [Prosthecochloris sp.]
MKKFLTLFAFLVAAGWTNAEAVDWNWKGDVRYRYEIQDKEHLDDNRDRHRIRVRVGVYPWINEELSAGIQFATAGAGDPVSRNQTLGDGFTAKDINLNEAFIDFHPVSYGMDGKVNFILGKREVKSTFVRTNDLVWDSDVTLEGLTFHYGKDGSKQKSGLNLVAGYYFLEEDGSSERDAYVWTAQAAYTGKAGDLGFTLGAGYYDFENIQDSDSDVFGDWANEDNFGNSVYSWDEYLYDYNVLELFASLGGKFNGGLSWKAYGQYAVNVAEDVDEDNNGYLVGFKLGDAKKVGDWAIDANYSYLEKDAVVGAYTDSDRWGGGTDGEGFEIAGTYHLVQNMTVGLKYLNHAKGVDSDASNDGVDIWQADMVVKF